MTNIGTGGSRHYQYVNPDKVLLWENTRKEVREALESGRLKAAIVPTGSTEQHNEHMALGTDFAMATFLSQRVALELYPQAIVSTPCPVGYAPYHMARKGTLTLRRETFKAFVYDVIESLKAHGFNTVLVLNGHGGNYAPLKEAIPEWRESLGITLDMEMPSPAYTEADLVRLIQSYRDAKAGLLNDVQESAMSHASEVETSRVLRALSSLDLASPLPFRDRAPECGSSASGDCVLTVPIDDHSDVAFRGHDLTDNSTPIRNHRLPQHHGIMDYHPAADATALFDVGVWPDNTVRSDQ